MKKTKVLIATNQHTVLKGIANLYGIVLDSYMFTYRVKVKGRIYRLTAADIVYPII